MAKKIKTASIAPTKPRSKPPSRRPSGGIKRKRKPDGRFA